MKETIRDHPGQELDLHDISSDSFRKILSDQKKSYLCV
jgi:hypothetical protein